MLFYIYHDGVQMKFRKGNTIGMVTRFGPDWPGARCGAKTQSGEPCKKASMKGRSRCRNHGGCATGPRTEAGRARIAAAHILHGRLTKEKRAEAKRRAKDGREVRAELRSIEQALIAKGLLAKGWRNQFD